LVFSWSYEEIIKNYEARSEKPESLGLGWGMMPGKKIIGCLYALRPSWLRYPGGFV
jgi:hypothetical protein